MTVSRSICLGFLVAILVGAGLLLLPISTASGDWNSPVVALFTATSAVCVTGHVVVDTGSYFSPVGQVFILTLIQLGGLGYMVSTTFLLLLLGRKFGLRDKIALQQALDRSKLQGSNQMVVSIISAILVFELMGIILLFGVFSQQYPTPLALWYAVFHSISAWNNAGFSLFPDSLSSYQFSWIVNLTISGLVIIGGIGYEAIFEVYLWLRDRLAGQQKRTLFSLNFRVVTSTTVMLLTLGTIAFYLTESRNPDTLQSLSWNNQLISAWFQSMTTRTAGFNTIDIGSMTNAGLFLTIAFMYVGGSPGGTGGGVKTTTIRVLSSCTQAILRGKESVTMYERQVPVSLILKAVGVVVGSITTIVSATTLMSIADPGVEFINILFEVVSAYATVGLSTGITAALTGSSKLILAATMYMGRVGVLLLMAALLGDPRPSTVRYPEESLLVG